MHFYVLDLDDTLYLERDYVQSGFRAVDLWIDDRFNVSGFFDHAWDRFESGSRGHIFDEALTDLNLFDEALVKQLVQIYRSHTPNISLTPDAAAFLSLYSANTLGIITDGFAVAQRKKLRSLGLETIAGKIIVTDEWGRDYWKPHPRAFRYIQGNLPAECFIYIADNPHKDFKAPAELGWGQSIRIRRKGSLHYDSKTPENCIEIDSLSQLRL